MKAKLFAHSRLDALLVGLALAQGALLCYGALTAGSLPWAATGGLWLLCAFLVCTNYQCVAHNLIHNPFFSSRRLNSAFAVLNSPLIGAPQTLYRIHHLHHHRYNNDAPDPATGTTRDFTSTWRYGRPPGEEEGLLTYALFGYFRSDFCYLLAEAKRRGLRGQVAAETLAVLGAALAIGLANPLGLVAFYLPVWFLGTVAAQAENYLEHHGALPGNRKTDSVSCYGGLYNLVWFNNGYHQEHHYRPQVHWSRLPTVKALLPPEAERRVVHGAHWFNFGPRRDSHARPAGRPEAEAGR
jgi:fatty acid desaturase